MPYRSHVVRALWLGLISLLALAAGALPVGALEAVFNVIYRGVADPDMPGTQGFLIVLAYRLLPVQIGPVLTDRLPVRPRVLVRPPPSGELGFAHADHAAPYRAALSGGPADRPGQSARRPLLCEGLLHWQCG